VSRDTIVAIYMIAALLWAMFGLWQIGLICAILALIESQRKE
jgi:hypothetical protein